MAITSNYWDEAAMSDQLMKLIVKAGVEMEDAHPRK